MKFDFDSLFDRIQLDETSEFVRFYPTDHLVNDKRQLLGASGFCIWRGNCESRMITYPTAGQLHTSELLSLQTTVEGLKYILVKARLQELRKESLIPTAIVLNDFEDELDEKFSSGVEYRWHPKSRETLPVQSEWRERRQNFELDEIIELIVSAVNQTISEFHVMKMFYKH